MKKIKKVLLVCSIYHPNVGGIETVIEQLSQYYRRAGVQVRVLTKKWPDKLRTRVNLKGIPVLRMPLPLNEKDFEKCMDFLLKYEKLIKSDIVHTIGIRRHTPLFGFILSKRWRVPYIVTVAGGDIPNPEEPETLQLWEEGKISVPESVCQSDKVLSFSNDIKKLIQISLPKVRNVGIIMAGIDCRKIDITEPRIEGFPYFFSARRLTYAKGIDQLIIAFGIVSVKLPKHKLIIAGDGPELPKLKTLAKTLGLESKVLFLGEIDLESVYSYMKSAICHVCPSRTEGGGVVNFEAQAAKCFAIGSSAGGIPEYILNNKTGIIYPVNDLAKLAVALEKVATNTKFREKIIDNAYKFVQRYDWTAIGEDHLKIYNDVSNSGHNKKFIPWSKLTENLSKYIN